MPEKEIELNLYFSEKDFFYCKNYARLYLKDGEEILEFSFREGENLFYNLSIKRPILNIKNEMLDDLYYDLETPYGFSGYFTNTTDKAFIDKALRNYTEYCQSQKIIAEFIRFHPLNMFPNTFSNSLDFLHHDRDVVLVDLTKNKEIRWKEYRSVNRNEINRASKELKFITLEKIEENRVLNFLEIYTKTMERNNADRFYYFSMDFIVNLLSNTPSKLFLTEDKNGQITSGAIFVESEELVSYFIGAKNYELNKRGSMEFLMDCIFDYYKSRGKKVAILGGGRFKDPNDPLFRFKKGFSNIILPFFIGGKIFIKDIYEKYCNFTNFSNNRFLRYRYD